MLSLKNVWKKLNKIKTGRKISLTNGTRLLRKKKPKNDNRIKSACTLINLPPVEHPKLLKPPSRAESPLKRKDNKTRSLNGTSP